MFDIYFTCAISEDFMCDLFNFMTKHDVNLEIRQKITSMVDAHYNRQTEYISGRATVMGDDWDEFHDMVSKYAYIFEEVKNEE